MKEPEVWESARLLYSSVLVDTVAERPANTEDLPRLVALKWTLGLGPEDIASCHQKVAREGGSGWRGARGGVEGEGVVHGWCMGGVWEGGCLGGGVGGWVGGWAIPLEV